MGEKRRWHKPLNVAMALAILMALGVALLPQPAYADPDPGWYDANWAYRRAITIDYTKVISALSYDGQTGDFTVGDTITGESNGATATIESDDDEGTSGTLYVKNVSGTFQDNEPITDEHTGSATVNGTLSTPSNFPVLVHIDSSDTDFWSHASSKSEVVFTESDGMIKLKREVEEFDHTNDDLFAWVRTSLSSSTDTVLYMYYGNASASETDDADTWDSNYKGVWHLTEDAAGTGTTDLYKDSTSNNNDGDDYVSDTGKTGSINGGQNFDGDDWVDITNLEQDISVTTGTIEVWINMDSAIVSDSAAHAVFEIGDSSTGNHFLGLRKKATNDLGMVYRVSTVTYEASISDISGFGGVWKYVVGVWDASNVYIYEDGTSINTSSRTGGDIILSNLDQSFIAADAKGVPGGHYFNGIIDEVRVSNIARSSEWIKTSYNNQNSPSNFYSVGHEEEKPSPFSQRWYLSSTAGSWVMYKGDHTKTAGTVTVADNGSEIWIADEAATANVGFPANSWTGHITFDTGSSDTTVRVYVGKWDGSIFTPSAGDEHADVSGSSDFSISASLFTVPETKWLAFKIEDLADGDSDTVIVSVGGNNSYVTSPSSEPGYPIPELPTIILIGTGLACLGGYIAFMRRKRRVASS